MPRPQARQRYNAKARQSTLGGSSHKKRRRNKADPNEEEGEEGTFEGIVEDDDNEERGGAEEPEPASRAEVSLRQLSFTREHGNLITFYRHTDYAQGARTR